MKEEFEINKIYTDDYGRVSGIFAVNKPVGVTSHDLVYHFRKKFNTPKVGHAGALDPFATGLLIILVGKALKASDSFLNLDKEYIADILFGVSTDSGDTEGRVVNEIELNINNFEAELTNAINSLTPEYLQYVPVFSSVKVNGQKLRILARQYENFNIIKKDDQNHILFYDKEILKKEVKLPSKIVRLFNTSIISSEKIAVAEVLEKTKWDSSKFRVKNLYTTKINVGCSKGTYIRQLAVDIGEKFIPSIPAMLIGLQRTKIGEYNISNVFDL